MGSERERLRSLIEKATHTISRDVDQALLKSIKKMVRSSDDNVHTAAEALMEIMKKNHAQVRYLALVIVDELFMRSKLFRSCVVVHLDQFLSLSVGFRRSCPLPPPPNIALTLRTKSIESLEKWTDSFGLHYRQLRLGTDYLKNTLHFQFPNLQETANRVRQERREREVRTQEILRNKFESMRNSYSTTVDEIHSALHEIEECIQLLYGSKEKEEGEFAEVSQDGVEDFGSLTLRKIRLDSIKESKKVREDNDNRAIFETLRDLYKLLLLTHLNTVQESISVLIRVDGVDSRFRDSALKQFIDLRNFIQSAKKKCEELRCVLPNVSNDEDGILWEEGKIETDFPQVGNESSKLNESLNIESSKEVDCGEASDSRKATRDGKVMHEGDTSDLVRNKLLDEAPVVTWGSYLDNWGSKREFLANQRGLEVEGHWGRVDHDATIPAEKIAELSVHATVYKEEQPEIRPCLAPLKKGGLCQRRDVRVCPFHGPIIPRDSKGNPAAHDRPQTNSAILREDHLHEKVTTVELAQLAVKNVRREDKEKEKGKQIQRKAKRAKLAEVREHNEAVLRESAMASTSQGLGEALGEDIEGLSRNTVDGRNKKQTLASMLHKKITRRDRLAQRLLNSQTTDATIRKITEADDARYREAYPNQW